MDLADLKHRAQVARQFDVVVDHGVDGIGPVSITLRVPTRHEASVAYMESAGRVKAASDVRFERALLLCAIVGWAGVRVRHVLPDSPQASDAIELEPDAVALVLDAQPAWEDALLPELLARLTARNTALEAAEKN